MTCPTVSILIPTFNRPELLRRAVESCLRQTSAGECEILISDNSENDDTRTMIESMAHPAVTYRKNEQNLGSYRNIMNLFEMARGRYLKLLMDDDLLKEQCLSRMVGALEANPSAGVVMAPLEIIDEEGRRIHPRFYMIKRMSLLYRYADRDMLVPGRRIIEDYLTRRYPCCVPSGIMYRRECFDALGMFDREAGFAGDVEICMRFALKYDFYYIDEPLSAWCFNKDSDTVSLHSHGQKDEIFFYLTRKYLNDSRLADLFPPEERGSLARNAYLFASKRCFLTILAGLRTGNAGLVRRAVRTILDNDPYRANLLRLPLAIGTELLESAMSWLGRP